MMEANEEVEEYIHHQPLRGRGGQRGQQGQRGQREQRSSSRGALPVEPVEEDEERNTRRRGLRRPRPESVSDALEEPATSRARR